jgi:hypothetical protein
VNAVNPWEGDAFFRNLIGVAAVPNAFSAAWFTQGDGTAAQLDNKHRPLILMQAAELGDIIVRKASSREVLAAHCLRSGCDGLPGVSNVVGAISIGPVAVLPRFPPHNAGQDQYDGRNVPR